MENQITKLVPLNLYHIYSLEGRHVGQEEGSSRFEALTNFMAYNTVEQNVYYAGFKKQIDLVNKKCPSCGYNNHRISDTCDNCGTLLV